MPESWRPGSLIAWLGFLATLIVDAIVIAQFSGAPVRGRIFILFVVIGSGLYLIALIAERGAGLALIGFVISMVFALALADTCRNEACRDWALGITVDGSIPQGPILLGPLDEVRLRLTEPSAPLDLWDCRWSAGRRWHVERPCVEEVVLDATELGVEGEPYEEQVVVKISQLDIEEEPSVRLNVTPYKLEPFLIQQDNGRGMLYQPVDWDGSVFAGQEIALRIDPPPPSEARCQWSLPEAHMLTPEDSCEPTLVAAAPQESTEVIEIEVLIKEAARTRASLTIRRPTVYLLVVLDASRRMEDYFDDARSLVNRRLSDTADGDFGLFIGIYRYGGRTETTSAIDSCLNYGPVVPLSDDPPASPSQAERELEKLVVDGNEANLLDSYDDAVEALARLQAGSAGTKAVVLVVTGGVDSCRADSEFKYADLVTALSRNNVDVTQVELQRMISITVGVGLTEEDRLFTEEEEYSRLGNPLVVAEDERDFLRALDAVLRLGVGGQEERADACEILLSDVANTIERRAVGNPSPQEDPGWSRLNEFCERQNVP